MHQHVTQLLAYFLVVVLHQRVTQFVCFLYCIRTQAFVCLLPVPRTFFSQLVNDVEQSPEGFHFLFFRMHNIHFSVAIINPITSE